MSLMTCRRCHGKGYLHRTGGPGLRACQCKLGLRWRLEQFKERREMSREDEPYPESNFEQPLKQKVQDSIARGKAKLQAEQLLKQKELRMKIEAERVQNEQLAEAAWLFVNSTLLKMIEDAAAKGDDRVFIDDDKHGRIPHVANAAAQAGLCVTTEYEPAADVAFGGMGAGYAAYYRYYVSW